MAPGYRASGRDRNRNRTYVDHDVFEGLPVLNWRRDTVNLAPPATHEATTKPTDKWDVELPYGMPKDSHMLPQHSQDLLRAARSGRLYVKRPAAEDEEVDAEPVTGDKPEKKEDDSKDKGFLVMTWKRVPKHQEGPEIEYLAKRRKGLVGNAVKSGVPPVMTQTKVKRTDAAGNSYEEVVVVAQGQTIEGEVISQVVIPDAANANAMPTPQRRRDRPKPKRKLKGPGRGRKKKASHAPTSVPGAPGAVKAVGEAQVLGTEESTTRSNGVKLEPSVPTANEDTEMGDDSIHPSGDDGEDDEDGSSDEEDDHDGNEAKGDGEGNDDQDEEMDNSPEVPGSDLTPPTSIHEQPEQRTPPELPRPTITHEYSGSPLKKVMTPPAYENHSIDESGDEEADGDLDDHVDDDMEGEMGRQHDYPLDEHESENPYHEMGGQMGSPDATMDNDGEDMPLDIHHVQGDSGSYDDEEMLLDGDMDNMDDVDFSAMAAVSGAPEDHSRHGHLDQQLDSGLTEESPMLESTLVNMQERLAEEAEAEGRGDEGFEGLLGEDMQEPPQEDAATESGEAFDGLLGGLMDHLDAQQPDEPAMEATITALEEVATAADPDAALEEAAAVARSGVVAEAENEGVDLKEPLAAEPVVEAEAKAQAEETGHVPALIAELEVAQEEKAEGVAANLEIPSDAVVEAKTEDGETAKQSEQIEHVDPSKKDANVDANKEELTKAS